MKGQATEAPSVADPAAGDPSPADHNASRPPARAQSVGPALKAVPENKGSLPGVAAVQPPAAGGNVSPIKILGRGPVVQPIGPVTAPVATAVRPPAPRAVVKSRHRLAVTTLLLFVVLPVVLLAGYLMQFAQNQYASDAGFSVRKEEGASSMDVLGGLTQLTGSASTDAEILYDYIRSQDLVTQLDKDLNLASIYGRNYERDPMFSLKPDANIEEKMRYWQRMMTVRYNESTGIIRLEVRAFTAEEAQKVGRAVIGYSSLMINKLAEVARDDATRYARNELARSAERLKKVRQAITEYRSRNQLVDPISDIQGQQGLLTNLQGQLAEALIELDVLRGGNNESDPRIGQMERRIEVIQKRIEEERSKFGVGIGGTADSDDYSLIVAEYESLAVDRTVAEETFRSATLIYEAAQAEANRKSRYLAAHVEPTLAQGALYPKAAQLLAITAFFLGLGWSLILLIYYSVRDRR